IALLGFYFTNVRDVAIKHNARLVETEVERITQQDRRVTPEQARERVVINTFALVLLAHAGEEASRFIKQADQARENLTVAQQSGDAAAVQKAEEALKPYENPQAFL